MSFRFPGREGRFTIRAPYMILGAVVVIALVWAGYVGFNLVRTESRIHKEIPKQALATLPPAPKGTKPVVIFPTPKTKATKASPTPTSTTGSRPSPTATETKIPPKVRKTATAVIARSDIKSWHGKKRINVLLVGIDQRNPGESTRTDTIIVASLDFQHNEINVLSIPRDLYVYVPGYGYWKINAAYPIGDLPQNRKRTGGGIGLLILTLRQNFGISGIDEYAMINFKGFVKGINALGGIDVKVPRKLVDPDYPVGWKTKRIVFEPGWQHMNGERALEYARTRHPDSDFGRMKRQQQVLLAVKHKAKNPAIILKAPELLRIVGDNLQTSLSFGEQLRLGRWMAAVPNKNIHFYTIEGPVGTTQDGQSVVWPEWREINPILKKVFGRSAGHRGE